MGISFLFRRATAVAGATGAFAAALLGMGAADAFCALLLCMIDIQRCAANDDGHNGNDEIINRLNSAADMCINNNKKCIFRYILPRFMRIDYKKKFSTIA